MSAAGTLRVGIDLVSVEEVADSVRHFGDRYVTRIYTSHEIDSCRAVVGRKVAGACGQRVIGDQGVLESL